MPKIRLLEEMDNSGDYDPKEITAAQERFEAWLTKQGYDLAVNGAPYDIGSTG